MNKLLVLLLSSVLCITFGTSVAPAPTVSSSLLPTNGAVLSTDTETSKKDNNASITVQANIETTTQNVSTPSTAEVQNKSVTTVKPQNTVNKPPQKAHPANSITSSSVSSSPASNKATAIISTAKQFTGVPYVFGGATPQGFDCSGFVQYVFGKNSINLPRVSRDQFTSGTSVTLNLLQPADLIFFSLAQNGIVDHVGIYIGRGEFINAASSKGVTIYTLGTYWKSRFIGAKREL